VSGKKQAAVVEKYPTELSFLLFEKRILREPKTQMSKNTNQKKTIYEEKP
jgi:hypothetical protein